MVLITHGVKTMENPARRGPTFHGKAKEPSGRSKSRRKMDAYEE